MKMTIKCSKPCEQYGQFIYCYHDSGKYPYLKCGNYQKQMEERDMIELNDVGLVRVVNTKGERE